MTHYDDELKSSLYVLYFYRF